MSEKVLIAEVADNTVWYDFFPYAQNVWLVQTDNDYSTFANIDFGLEEIDLFSELFIISIQVRKEPYIKVDTISDVIAVEKSFYFNSETRMLLIHFEDHKPYYYFGTQDIEIGFIIGFYSSPASVNATWNDTQYISRLISSPVLSNTKDDLYYAKQILQSASIEIDNHDLKFKAFNIGNGIKKKNGNFVRTLIWTGEDADNALYDDFIVTFQGVIEKVREGRTIKLDLRDIRSILKEKSPSRYLDTSTYSYIKDTDKKYILPQLWGKCYDVPCQCLNENVNDGGGSTAYEFLVCDTVYHTIAADSIKIVYINNKKTALTPTITFDTNQKFAKFSIAAINFAYYNGTSTRYENMDKVSIDVYGYLKGLIFRESDGTITSSPNDLIENGLAVIRQIIFNNYGWDYISALYDITTWKSFEDNAYKIGYFLDSPTSTQEQIEKLSNSQLGKFIWNENLKFSFDNDDFDKYKLEIPKDKFFPQDFIPEFNIDSTEVLSIFRIGYQKRWNTKDDEAGFIWVTDESNKEEALVNYNSTLQKDFNTLINNLTDTLDFASRILIFGGISKDTFTILTSWDARNLKAGEWVKVQADHSTEELVGWTKCQIQKVSPKIENWLVELELRIFAYLQYVKDNNGNFIVDQEGRRILLEAK